MSTNTQKLTASIPHRLTWADARRRIQEELEKLHRQQAALLGDLRETWHGDTMDFSGRVMGQFISGRLDVEDQAVRVEVDLPWLLAALAGALKPQIENQGRRLLAGPKAG